MKNLIVLVLAVFLHLPSFAQQAKTKPLYDTLADAKTDIKKAVALAAKEHKNVMLQVGGNWCIWCTRFHNTVAGNDTLSQLMNDNYVVVHVNYEKKLEGKPIWKDLGYPQRFGFPVFVILDEKGNRIHTQNSAYLEEGKGHSPEKIAEFLKQWSPAAVQGKTLQK
jgi:thioredoxin-related protein